MYKIYTDGSCAGNQSKENSGGWGFIVLDEQENEIARRSGKEENTTNNKMEMEALKQALLYVRNYLIKQDNFKCEIFSDSAYIINCFKAQWYKSWQSNGWMTSTKRPVKNQDYWKFFIPYFDDKRFKFSKIKGHQGHQYNELVDKLAKGEIK
ncbi:MAG: ribonuclease HI [Spirochaetia bacterium]|nr:ribonuclease HI [Spirochaetia bacterium]